MTVSAAKLEREKDKLFVTDAELIRRLGVPEKIARRVIRALDAKPSGFPKQQELWGNRRYWPAIEKWLESSHGMLMNDAARLAAESRYSRSRLPRRSSPAVAPAEGHHERR